MPIDYHAEKRVFTLSGGECSYGLHITPEGQLMHLYWGRRVPDGAITPHLAQDYPVQASFDLAANCLPWELPTLGQGWYGTPALDIRNAAGDHVLQLRYAGHRIYAGKKPLEGLPAVYAEQEREADSLEIDLQDSLLGLQVTLQYTVLNDSGAVARSMRVCNAGSETVQIMSAAAASVPLWGSDYDVIHLKGAWGRERAVIRTPMGQGEYAVFSRRGASGHEENPFMALCEPSATEHTGGVWAVSYIYSGSFYASAAADVLGNARLSMGMDARVFTWQLRPGEAFQTPEAILVYSHQGLNGMSQIYHRLYRLRLARGWWRDRQRPVLINNWEATYFDFTEDKILSIARQAHALGIELFVLDDGWFGDRNDDHTSLGDWTVNRKKLPGGLSGLAEKIHAMGMLFGLWVEPEMISPDSDLYRAHPDWCLHVAGRERTEARHQLVLDMSRAEVQEYVITAISAVLRESGADYIKWDMNRNMTEYFSPALPPERRMETQHRYMLGLYRVLEAITASFPRVLFESCSGGGGRFDGGMLFYMPQTWTSDNTDAMARLQIQYGTSMVYPACAMGAHVSAVPNHQCGRVTAMQTRCDVAIGGNFGFELDLTALSAEDLDVAKRMVRRVNQLRGLTQTGKFTRLISPEKHEYAAWQFTDEEKSQALLCVYRILSVANTAPIRIRMYHLNPDALYHAEDGRVFSGAELMYQGMTVTLTGDFSSQTILFSQSES